MIRPAQASDAPEVAALWNAMIRDTLATFTTVEKSDEALAQMIAVRQAAFLVAEQDNRVVGFMSFAPFREGPGYGATVEHTVVVAPHWHAQSLGRQLMQKGFEMARAQSKHVMVAAISSANPQAVLFHKKLGFIQTAHMPEVGRKNGQWLDLILMQKTL